MIKRQKMLMVTCFYDPAVAAPEAMVDGTSPITEEALFTGIEECVAKGGIVRVSHIKADLLRLTCSQNGCPPTHEWVGLTFVPVFSATKEAVLMEEAVNAY